MARERTADDQVLQLLSRRPMPLPAAEIAEALGWEKSMVSKILRRIAAKLQVTEDRSNGSGRPTQLYSLKQPETRPAGHVPIKPRFEKDTIVITPSNCEARVVLHRRDGFVEIERLTGPREDARTCLHESLLRAFQPGRDRPAPVVKT